MSNRIEKWKARQERQQLARERARAPVSSGRAGLPLERVVRELAKGLAGVPPSVRKRDKSAGE